MILTLLRLLSVVPNALRLRSDLALENLALRQQLAVLNRTHRRPRIRQSDRLFWMLLFWFLGELEGNPGHRPTRNRSSLASKTLCLLLDPPVAEAPSR